MWGIITAFVNGIMQGLISWWREIKGRQDMLGNANKGDWIKGKMETEAAEKAAEEAAQHAKDAAGNDPLDW